MPVLKSIKQKEKFDPTNKAHREVYRHWLETGKMLQTFELEFPFTNVVSLMERKLAEYAVNNIRSIK